MILEKINKILESAKLQSGPSAKSKTEVIVEEFINSKIQELERIKAYKKEREIKK